MRQERRIPTPLRPRRPGSGSAPRARRRAGDASEPAAGDLDIVGHSTALLLARAEDADDALQLECLVSSFLPCWGHDPLHFDMNYIESTTLAIIEELEATGDSLALAVLRGLEAVASGAIAEESAAAADRLAANGVTAPAWARHIGGARAV